MLETWNILRPQIEYLTKRFPRAAMAFANAHREAVTPHLIEVLEKVAADPSLVDDAGFMLHSYALHLLASWREPRAFAAMVALGHHDEDTVEMLLGDAVTESYGRCLASVCGDDIAPLKALFEDTQASHWTRNAALDAMLVRVFQGDGSRDELLAYLMAQGEAQAERLRRSGRGVPDVVDCIVSVAGDLGALEMRAQIHGWFDAGWLDENFSHQDRFEQEVVRPFEVCRAAAGPHIQGYIVDVESEMAWWDCFAQATADMQPPRPAEWVSRTDPCACGSGKSWENCHGAAYFAIE